MPSRTVPRRRLLETSAALVTFSGCLSETPESESGATCSPEPSTDRTPTPERGSADGAVRVASLAVTDFLLYPLAGHHPHVHRKTGTQYIIARAATSYSRETVRERLTLELDGESVPLAERQPVPFEHDTVDLAFAVSKRDEFDDGRVLFDQTELRSPSDSTIARLNTPPVFKVSEPSVAPNEISAGEQTVATVQFDLANTGDGCGTFGASLSGNLVSGSNTVTATLAAGAQRAITASVDVVGEGDEATVRLDWGSNQWSGTVPVL